MILNLEEQANFFLLMVALGGGLGLVYDCLRIFRKVIVHNGFLLQVEDGIFWLCAAFFSFWVVLQRNSGEMRFFVILGLFGGMVLYFWGASREVRMIGEGVLGVLGKIFRLFLEILCTPFRLVYLLVRSPLERFGGFCVRKQKKCLYFCKNYVKIKSTRIGRDWKAFCKSKNWLGVNLDEQKRTTTKQRKTTKKKKK